MWPSGKDKLVGAVKALACCAVDGCVVMPSIAAKLSQALRKIRRQKVGKPQRTTVEGKFRKLDEGREQDRVASDRWRV